MQGSYGHLTALSGTDETVREISEHACRARAHTTHAHPLGSLWVKSPVPHPADPRLGIETQARGLHDGNAHHHAAKRVGTLLVNELYTLNPNIESALHCSNTV
jgi:hypothetical protein